MTVRAARSLHLIDGQEAARLSLVLDDGEHLLIDLTRLQEGLLSELLAKRIANHLRTLAAAH